jgi:hypothetical protein
VSHTPVLVGTLGFKGDASLMSSVITGLVNVFATVVSIFTVDRLGCRSIGKMPKGYATVVVLFICVYMASSTPQASSSSSHLSLAQHLILSPSCATSRPHSAGQHASTTSRHALPPPAASRAAFLARNAGIPIEAGATGDRGGEEEDGGRSRARAAQ